MLPFVAYPAFPHRFLGSVPTRTPKNGPAGRLG